MRWTAVILLEAFQVVFVKRFEFSRLNKITLKWQRGRKKAAVKFCNCYLAFKTQRKGKWQNPFSQASLLSEVTQPKMSQKTSCFSSVLQCVTWPTLFFVAEIKRRKNFGTRKEKTPLPFTSPVNVGLMQILVWVAVKTVNCQMMIDRFKMTQ